MTAFIAGLLYRAALDAQHRSALMRECFYPTSGSDVFSTLLAVMS
jgi:hypothetical protein